MESDKQLSEGNDASIIFHQRTLCEELWNLRSKGIMCDVILEVAGERLWAHRVILSACSSRFKLFFSKSTPTFSQVIKIENCSYKVCLQTLEHLYTGRTVLLSGSLLEEFKCFCEAWELKQPLFTPAAATASCGDVSDSSECAHFRQESLDCGQMKCQTNTDLGAEGQKSLLGVLDGKPNENKQAGPTVPVSTVTRPHQKRTRTSQTSSKTTRKTRKIASVKVELERGKSSVQTPEKHINYHSASDAELDLITAYNDDTDCSWDGSLDDNNIKQIPAKPQVQPKRQSRGKSKGNHSIKVNKKLSNGARPCGRPRKKLGKSGIVTCRYVKKRCKFLCRQCSIEFESRTELIQHRKNIHKKNTNCAQCQLTFPEKNQLLAHNIEHHWTEGLQLPEIYACMVPGCTFNTHKRMSWYNHRLHAHPSECSICDICGKTLKNELTLRQHKAVVHPTGPRKVFSCSACEKVFKTESSLQKHAKVAHRPWTTERDRFVCPYCAHTCMLAESLTEHLYKKHNILTPSKKSYQCQHCNFKTTHIAEIRKHEIRHKPDNEKPFECDKCMKRFVDRGSLVSHQLKHSISANTFKCQYCDYSTKYTHNLRAHIQVRHENKDHKPWECNECSYRCNSKGNLYKHLRNVHKRTVETKYTVSRIGSHGVERASDDMTEINHHVDQSHVSQLPNLVPTKDTVEPGWDPPHNPLPGSMWPLQPQRADNGTSEHSGDVSGGGGRHCDNGSVGVELAPTAGLIQSVSKPYAAPHLPLSQPVPQYDYMVDMRPVPAQNQEAHHRSPSPLTQATLPAPHSLAVLTQATPPVQLPPSGDMNSLLYPYPGF